jgi:NADP-dependent aldehyde dehydrogenase
VSSPSSAPVLIGGAWRPSKADDEFRKHSPIDGEELGSYPVSPWEEIAEALDHGARAYRELAALGPDVVAGFLEGFADRIERAAEELVETAHRETALPVRPRLLEVELPRTVDQLRQAAAAARSRSWTLPTLSPEAGIASFYAPIPGAVAVFGPNNFPFAFNSAAGGDVAAALATRHPVIAKANPGHPGTTRILAREAHEAALETGLPPATVQLVYRTSHDDGGRLVADPRLAATGYTGSRAGGLALKDAADRAGKPIYLEMSSINPVVVLAGALRERGAAIADELTASALLGTGQFCTSPGVILVPAGADGDTFVDALGRRFAEAPVGTLLDEGVRRGLEWASSEWAGAGAVVVARAPDPERAWCRFANTVMAVEGGTFLAAPEPLQAEAFGNMLLVVRYGGGDELVAVLRALEANLTGTVYSDTGGGDDELYAIVEPELRERVGRLLNDKMPTGVAVVAAMNHGGPYPSTGHPGFTAVGIPASLRRFGMLQCYDAVRPERLPDELRPDNPLGIERLVGERWTAEPVRWGASG